ncbi:zinc knuckle domain-containing protein [Trichoderma sp. SZMC 28014]
MFTYRGRGGPSRSTPANVQCQKCLKRGHYSYECKSSTQERPYVSRPSRSQQLRNPKLVPKLTSDTPNPLEKKKGVADEELAKLEAERERKREREDREDELLDTGSRRQRSISSQSVSTISTDASRDSRSPPPKRRTRSPVTKRRDHNPKSASNRSYSADSASDRSYSRSPSPPRRQRRSASRDSRSPSREGTPESDRNRYGQPSHARRDDASPPRQRYDQGPGSRRGIRRGGSDSRSRSPQRDDQPYRRRDDDNRPRGGRRGGGYQGQGRMPPRDAPRERSLSPFSKRLALTQSMNMGGR